MKYRDPRTRSGPCVPEAVGLTFLRFAKLIGSVLMNISHEAVGSSEQDVVATNKTVVELPGL